MLHTLLCTNVMARSYHSSGLGCNGLYAWSRKQTCGKIFQGSGSETKSLRASISQISSMH